jgi:transposase-like protein
MAAESAEPIERWTAKRRVALVIRILKGETSVAEAARQQGLTVAEIEAWREQFLLGAENALRTRPKGDEALKDEQVKKLKQKIGELVLDNDILREALKPYPLDRKTSDARKRRCRVSRNGPVAGS